MFGTTGSCAACGQTIGPHEMVLKTSVTSPSPSTSSPRGGSGGISSTGPASLTSSPPPPLSSSASYSAVYHVQCFACAACHSRLVSGDRYRVVNGQIVCGDHDFGGNGVLTTGCQSTKSSTFQHVQRQLAEAVTPSTVSPMTAADDASCASLQTGKSAGVMSSGARHHGGRSRQKVCI